MRVQLGRTFHPLFVQQPCAVTLGNLVPGPQVIHWSLLVTPSERHFVIRERATGVQQRKDEKQAPTSTCNAGVQLTVLQNTVEKRSPHQTRGKSGLSRSLEHDPGGNLCSVRSPQARRQAENTGVHATAHFRPQEVANCHCRNSWHKRRSNVWIDETTGLKDATTP